MVDAWNTALTKSSLPRSQEKADVSSCFFIHHAHHNKDWSAVKSTLSFANV